METEIWKPIEGYEGFYEVSNTGRIKSVDRTFSVFSRGFEYIKSYRGREIKPIDSNGNLQVKLHKCGVINTNSVSKLVALHFLEGFKESGRVIVKFKDGNKRNCSVENLE